MVCFRQSDVHCGNLSWGCYCEAENIESVDPRNKEQCQSHTAFVGGIIYLSLCALCLIWMLSLWIRSRRSIAGTGSTGLGGNVGKEQAHQPAKYDASAPLLGRNPSRTNYQSRLRVSWMLFLSTCVSGVTCLFVAFSFLNANRGQHISCANPTFMLVSVSLMGLITLGTICKLSLSLSLSFSLSLSINIYIYIIIFFAYIYIYM